MWNLRIWLIILFLIRYEHCDSFAFLILKLLISVDLINFSYQKGNWPLCVLISASIQKKLYPFIITNNPNNIIKQEFFHNAVGGVRNIELYYNQYGKSTGNCMITFVTYEQAAALVKNYNGAPIDNGKSKLRLSLVVDTSRNVQPVALASRIGIPSNGAASKQATPKKAAPKEAKKNLKALALKKAKAAKKPVKKAQATKKPAPVSLEDLDKQMNDYFAPAASAAPAEN